VSRPGPTGVTFITDWWTVTDHEERSVALAGGRVGKQYRARTGPEVTTEIPVGGGTWQLYSRSADHYDDVLRCVDSQLAASAR
jgi:hypothetical protein